jgi:FtsP/CotA-like multicopper oxidase with cupredoxin domain
MKYILSILFIVIALSSAPAQAAEYSLTIARQPVTITGERVNAITVNGTIPGPTLTFQEGEEVIVHVTNKMNEDTSVHWHGLLIPPFMDGSPGFNGFKGIKPNETFTYRFTPRQSGTYWYHSHSMWQEQEGLYGALIIQPKGKDPVKSDRDYVVMLSDFTDEKPMEIMGHLKMASDYYNRARRTVGDFFDDSHKRGFKSAWQDAKDWGGMRMSQTDLADVSGYTFLTNGKTPDQNWTGLFKAGETVRLRFINAAAMTFYDVRIPDLKMTVVAADGQNVEPVPVDEFRFGIAETYDVLVTPPENKPYTIVAESLDRSGFSLGTLAPKEGMKGDVPTHRPRALLSMFDMNMELMMQDMPDMDMMSESANVSGWAKMGTPEGDKALTYADLRSLTPQPDTRPAEREIVVRLGGNMERYIWTLDGKKFEDAEPIQLKYNERVRLTFVNETMMAHPMHLHGMFVQLDNGQPPEKLPNKHIVIVPPGQSYSAFLTANEAGEWAFHCHLLYHMMSGMMNKVVVATYDGKDKPQQKMQHRAQQKPQSTPSMEHHHGHH